MHLKYFFALLFIVSGFSPVIANTAEVSGRVADGQTGETLPGAIVSIPDLRLTAVTNEQGQFTLKNTPDKGRFLVEVRFIGVRR